MKLDKFYTQALKKIIFNKLWLYLIFILVIINYANKGLILTLNKNYSVQVLTADNDVIYSIHKNILELNKNQVILTNRVMFIENKLGINDYNYEKVKKRRLIYNGRLAN